MKKLFLILAILFATDFVFAQNVSIEGSGSGISGKKIRLSFVEDGISLLEKHLQDYTVAKDDSTFSFAFTLDGVSRIRMRIDSYEYSFLAKPGMVYKMHIGDFNYDLYDSVNTLVYRYILPVTIENLPKEDINNRIADFDMAVSDYILNHRKELFVFRDRKVVDTLYALVQRFEQGEDTNSYFYDYIRYELGSIEYALKLKGRNKLRNELFNNRPIKYYNIGYMDCFNNLFGHYFSKGNDYISRRDLEFWLTTNNYAGLSDALGKDSVLRNEVFRELVFIKGMRDAYSDGDYNGTDVIRMLERFAGQTKFENHRLIAENVIEQLISTSSSGREFMDFKLRDVSDDTVSLSRYLEKPLVLNFVKLSDISSKRELEVINFLYDSIRNNCEILTISCDRNLDAMYNFLKNTKVGSKYKWKFVHFDSNYELLEYYKVVAFPTFILLSPEGRTEINPMSNPSEGGLSRFISR